MKSDVYIRSAVQWARENGTNYMEAEAYFSAVWFMSPEQSRYAAKLLGM